MTSTRPGPVTERSARDIIFGCGPEGTCTKCGARATGSGVGVCALVVDTPPGRPALSAAQLESESVSFGEVNDRLRVGRPTSSLQIPGRRTPGVVRFIASICKGLRKRGGRFRRPESAFPSRSSAGSPSRAPLRPLRSRILSLTAHRTVSSP